MNILLIPNNDWLNHPVPAQRHYKIFEEIGKRHNVYVLQFDIFKKNGKPTHTPKFTKVIRPFSIPVAKPAQFYMANLLFQGKTIFSTLKELDIEVVFGSNLAVCSMGFEVARRLGIKRVFDLSDFFPESAKAYFPNGNSTTSSIMRYLAAIFTNYNAKIADICTTCSLSLRDYMKKSFPKNRVEQLPNGVDTKVFVPKPPDEHLRNELGLDANVIVYVGLIESWMDFDPVLDAISLLKRKSVIVQLLIVGRSIYSETENPLHLSIQKRGLQQQVRFLGYKPYETLPDLINLGVGGLLPFNPNLLLTQMAFPNKLLEYLACGKPVFAPPMNELRNVGGRHLLEYRDSEMLASRIETALKLDFEPKEIRQSVIKYDWNTIAGELEHLIQELRD